ncbi:hypothetical protein LOK49_LG05G02349 [Camellia lanceoleosa]|uniref:Uncharacterized protein n=1 Tax=Camellia lanceoleosa TaxID=1840588 RepID=A0ACC0HQX9_9ERIC|nr:hypothetical protein LOK49_LG05G02349 [Camellia lanceoleosa]
MKEKDTLTTRQTSHETTTTTKAKATDETTSPANEAAYDPRPTTTLLSPEGTHASGGTHVSPKAPETHSLAFQVEDAVSPTTIQVHSASTDTTAPPTTIISATTLHGNSHGNTSSSKTFKDAVLFPFSSQQEADSPPDPFVSAVPRDDAVVDEVYPTISLSPDDLTRIRNPWKHSIIIKLLGKSLGYNYLMSKVRTLWKPSGTCHGLDLGNHFFLIKFQEEANLTKVLSNGTWYIGNHFLSVRRWEPEFQPQTAVISSAIIWAHLVSLPIEFYDRSVLERIGHKLGKLIKVDIYTATGNRGRFARICIQVDLNKPPMPTIRIDNILQRVAYEGLPNICFHCGLVGHTIDIVGHTIDKCPAKVHHLLMEDLTSVSTIGDKLLATHAPSEPRVWKVDVSDTAETLSTSKIIFFCTGIKAPSGDNH